MKYMSIDPSANGVTAIVVAKYDVMQEEPLIITNFSQVDFRAEGETAPEVIKEIRYQQLLTVLEMIDNERPDVVICENFIMFRQAMGAHGQSFITSEMIGVIDYHCRQKEIPVIKPRSSDVRSMTGYGKKEFKYGLRNQDLHSRGILGKVGRAVAVNVDGVMYKLKDFQIGSKNDHIIMAIKHLLNEIEYKNPDIHFKIHAIKRDRYNKEYE